MGYMAYLKAMGGKGGAAGAAGGAEPKYDRANGASYEQALAGAGAVAYDHGDGDDDIYAHANHGAEYDRGDNNVHYDQGDDVYSLAQGSQLEDEEGSDPATLEQDYEQADLDTSAYDDLSADEEHPAILQQQRRLSQSNMTAQPGALYS